MGSGSSLVTIAAVGDIMLGSDWPTPRLPTHDLLKPVAPLLAGADIAFGNLEGTLSDGGTVRPDKADPRRHFAFRTPTRYALWLERAGLDVLSVANNHAGDFQAAGRAATIQALRAHHLTPVGGPGVLRVTRTVHGVPVTFLGFSTGGASPNLNRIEAARALVEKARRRGGIVVVSFHGGAEGVAHQHVPYGPETFRGEARGALRKFSHALIDAGADLLLGHGPHVLRGLELYRHRLIAYSLGNFATYGRISIRGVSGVTAVLAVTLAKDGVFVGGRIHPCIQTGGGGPHPDPKRRAVRLLQRLSAQDFGRAAPRIAADGRISPRLQ